MREQTHWLSIAKMVGKKSPSAMRRDYTLCDPITAEIIYSEQAITNAGAQLRAAGGIPPSPAAKSVSPAQVAQSPPLLAEFEAQAAIPGKEASAFVTVRPPHFVRPPTPLSPAISAPQPGSSVVSDSSPVAVTPGQTSPAAEYQPQRNTPRPPLILSCPALNEATGLEAPIPVPGFEWSDLQASLHDIAVQLGLQDEDGRLTLVYRASPSAQPLVILSERIFQTLPDGGEFEVRLTARTPVKARSNDIAHLPESARRLELSQRLSFDPNLSANSAVSIRQTQAKYERAVRTNLESDLAKAFKTETTTTIMCTSLEVTLDAIRKIDKTWLAIQRASAEADDGVSQGKRLQWFIEACLEQLDEPAKLKWDNQLEHLRDTSYYPSLTAFLKQLFHAVVPPNEVKRPTALLEHLCSSLAPNNIDSLGHLLAKVEHQVQLAHTLGKLIQNSEGVLLEEEEFKFWEKVLSPTAKDALATALHLKAKPCRYQVAEGFEQPFTCYTLQEVRQALRARGGRQSDWKLDINWPASARALPPVNAAPGRPSARNATVPSENAVVRRETASTEKEFRTFTSSLDGSRITLPFKLRLEPSHQMKQQYEATFLKHNIFPQAVCKNRSCGLKGHTIHICPRFSRCDQQGIERNQRSFFEGLMLPKAALALPKVSRGTQEDAAVMMVTPTAPSLSTVDFQSTEFQAALQAAIQASLQRGDPSGNDRAGAAQ